MSRSSIHRSIVAAAMLALTTFLCAPGPALADSKYQYGKPSSHYKYDDDDCKYEYKENRGRVKESLKCKDRRGHRPPYGIDYGSCNRDVVGALIGGVVGGLAGSQFGDGKGRLGTTAAGVLAGVLLGGGVGRSMDAADRACVGQVFEHAPSDRPVAWANPDGHEYRVVPKQAYQDNGGRYCREYQATASVGGRPQETYGTACRQPDGSWQIVN